MNVSQCLPLAVQDNLCTLDQFTLLGLPHIWLPAIATPRSSFELLSGPNAVEHYFRSHIVHSPILATKPSLDACSCRLIHNKIHAGKSKFFQSLCKVSALSTFRLVPHTSDRLSGVSWFCHSFCSPVEASTILFEHEKNGRDGYKKIRVLGTLIPLEKCESSYSALLASARRCSLALFSPLFALFLALNVSMALLIDSSGYNDDT